MKVRELIKKLADRNMDAEVMVSTGDTYNDVSDFCLRWGGPHSTDSEKDHRDEEFVYIDFFGDNRENAALPDVPVGERIRNSIAMVLTDVDEQVLHNRALTLKAALEWLEQQGEQKAYVVDFKAKDWYVSKVDGKIYNAKFMGNPSTNHMCDAKHEIEKQGEQPTNKIEPKFKVGDWIIDEETPNDVFYVIGVLEEIYKVIDIDGQDYHIPHCKADKQFHLWSIDDAKDGDVLETDGSVFIYAKVLYNKPYAYCGVDKYGVFKDNCLENNWSNSVYNIHHATDKQRDQLEKAIMKAGYEWDSEKKELKKIEVASKEMEDERIRKGIIRNLKYLMDRSEGFVKEDLQERIAWLEKQSETSSSAFSIAPLMPSEPFVSTICAP